ncbi:MAG: pilus assembly protein CpaB [Paracoccaceae bacterium]|jgi:pilus assembly protein CpaB
MRLIFGLVLVFGLGLAGFAVFMAQGFISQMTAERDMLLAARAQAKPTVEVFAVNKPKAYGETLAREDLIPILWQQDALPEGVFTDIALLFPEGEDPRVVLRPMEKFEPVLEVKVTKPGEEAGITSRLDRGTRAFAISVDVSSGVSGFLRPGDSVDIYWTGRTRDREVTKLIEANVGLIAVDQTSDSGRSGPVIARTVTVQVKPQQVASLAQAQSTGRLSLSLVGAEDDTIAQVSDVDQNTLLGIAVYQEAKVTEPQVCTTKVRRGSEVIHQVIPCNN